jgi:hypothetical protein
MMEVICSSETPDFLPALRDHNADDFAPHSHGYQIIKSNVNEIQLLNLRNILLGDKFRSVILCKQADRHDSHMSGSFPPQLVQRRYRNHKIF